MREKKAGMSGIAKLIHLTLYPACFTSSSALYQVKHCYDKLNFTVTFSNAFFSAIIISSHHRVYHTQRVPWWAAKVNMRSPKYNCMSSNLLIKSYVWLVVIVLDWCYLIKESWSPG